MDKKQQITIPKFLWVLAGILVVCIIFLIAVQLPFSGKIDKYNSDHASAESQINVYKDYLAHTDEVTKSINAMKEECSKMNDSLMINASKATDDFRDMLKNVDYDPQSLAITEGKADKKGGVSSTGDPLYVSTIRFNFTATEQKLVETLKYFESKSKGSYFVSKISIVEEEPEKKKSGESSTAQESVTTANRLYNTNVEMSLYYFDPSKNKANSQKASGTSSSSSAASGSSAASA